MKIRERYILNESSKVGDSCVCPSCQTEFVKEHYQQKFCKTKGGTKCKDRYWNLVTPEKRNNTTRISPASKRWLSQRETERSYKVGYDDVHPFSQEALGQWDD